MGIYSGYNEAQYNNQSAYLNNLINNGTAGQKAWAQNEMNNLNSQYTGGSGSGNSGGSKPANTGGSGGSKPATNSGGSNVTSTTGGGSKPANTGGSGGGTNYSGYNEAQYNNQKTYLENLIAQGGGTGVWAQQEMNKLNQQYQPAQPTQPTTPSAPTAQPVQTQAQQQAIANNSTGKYGTSADNKYGTIHRYTPDGGYYTSTDGGKTFINTVTGEQMAGNTAQSSAGLTGGWNTIGSGKSGKSYEVHGGGSIIVNYSDGSYRIVNPNDSDYMVTRNAMAQDLADNGIGYTPSKTWSVTQDHYKLDGSGEIDYSKDVAYTYKDYLTGNTDLQYALEQYMKKNGTNEYDIEAYVNELYNSIGTQRNNGTTITLADIDKELGRLGLSDYDSRNAIYTSSGTVLPNNPFINFTTGQVMGSGDGLDFSNGEFANYNGQQYLIGGDVANYSAYARAKAGQATLLDYLFGDMANNPYAMQDPDFLIGYNQNLNNFNNSAGIQSSAPAGSLTGNVKVDNVINYYESLNNYNQATGGNMGTTNLLDLLKGYMDSGLEANQGFLDEQRAFAQQQAEQQKSDAWVNSKLQGKAMNEQMSALGLGTSGAVQSAQMGINNTYGNNLGTIDANLMQMLNGLSQDEVQLLSDYYNNMTKYAYQVTNDERDYQAQQAKLAMDNQQMLFNQQMAQREMELQKQQWDWQQKQAEQQWNWEQQQYNDSQNMNKANYYADLYNKGAMTDVGLAQALANLGMTNSQYLTATGATGKKSNSGTPAGTAPTGKIPTGTIPAGGTADDFSLTQALQGFGGSTGNTIQDYQANQNTRDTEMAYALYQSGLLDNSVNVGMLSFMSNGALEYALQHAKDPELRGMPVEVARAWIAQKLS